MIRTIARVLAVGVLAVMAVAGPAAARETSVVARGTCSGDSHWRLALVTDGEKIGAGYRVDAPAPGELWRVHIVHDGVTVFAGRRIATEPDGVFGVRVAMRNLKGPDVVRARALNTVTGEVCAGYAVVPTHHDLPSGGTVAEGGAGGRPALRHVRGRVAPLGY